MLRLQRERKKTRQIGMSGRTSIWDVPAITKPSRYVSCMLADECAVGRHSDRHDVSRQYNIFLGNYENAVYEVESPDGKEIREFTSTRKVLKVDARCRHRVNTVGFKGVRYCVTMYKMYDRTQKEPDPVFWPPVWI